MRVVGGQGATGSTPAINSAGSGTPPACDANGLVAGFVAGHNVNQPLKISNGLTVQAQQSSVGGTSGNVSVVTGYREVGTARLATQVTATQTRSAAWAAGAICIAASNTPQSPPPSAPPTSPPAATPSPPPSATPTPSATAKPTPTPGATATPTPVITPVPTAPPVHGVGPCGTVSAPPAKYQHVIWIWMENHSEGSLASGPYMSGLAKQCATATNWQDAGSQYNSEPNYMAATTGLSGAVLTPFTCDCPQGTTNQITSDNIFRQVRSAGLTERSYDESMNSNCQNSNSSNYAAKHNPAVFLTGGTDRQACLADDIPMGSNTAGNLVNAINSNTLPNFAFVTPNMCNDMHDCSVATGDAFLKVLVPQILNSASYKSGNTLLIINTDEDTPVLNIVVAPSVQPGSVVTTQVGHYGELRATEEALGLPLLGLAATATSLRGAFHI